MRFVVASHGHCFDGLSSAVLFTRLMQHLGRSDATFSYRACGYGVGQLRADESVLAGDENAILDYRYTASAKLSWYFDHHRTAFATEADRADFDARRAGGQFFFDPERSSCTKLIAEIAAQKFGLTDERLAELVRWADIVDAARFETAAQAVSRDEPVLRLVSVVEHYGDDAFFQMFVNELLKKPLSEVASSTWVSDRYRPLGKKHERFIAQVKEKSEQRGRVVFVDLTENLLESVGKFVTYALYPSSVYSVLIGRLKNGPKISVGYNPWSGQPLDADISAICARYGGGGHPVVGGISFGNSELERARLVAREIADELAG